MARPDLNMKGNDSFWPSGEMAKTGASYVNVSIAAAARELITKFNVRADKIKRHLHTHIEQATGCQGFPATEVQMTRPAKETPTMRKRERERILFGSLCLLHF